MKTPLWILDFNEGSCTAEFFEQCWLAYCQNTGKVSGEERWFYVSSCIDRTYEDILDDAGHLTLYRDKREPLIPAFTDIQKPRTLNVVLLGDVTDEKHTIPNLHFWAWRLREALLDDATAWTTVPRVHFYAMLWRPNTAAVSPGVSAATRGFLHELNMLMQQDVNHAPMRSVAFIETFDKTEAFDQMKLAVLHLSSNDFLGDNNSRRFVDLTATGVFYESAVHLRQSEYLLSNILVDKIANSTEEDFYNVKAAAEYVGRSEELLEAIESKTLADALTSDCPNPDAKTYAYDLKPGISPWSARLRQVWAEYYCDFIPNYKKNLVNRVKRALKTFVRDYKMQLFENQRRVVSSVAEMLQKRVFRIFIEHGASEHISLHQAGEILKGFQTRIQEASQDCEVSKRSLFAIPSELRGAARQAQEEYRSPQDTLKVIENKLANHPVAVFALVVRAVVLGFLLGFISWSLLPELLGTPYWWIVTVIVSAIPLVWSLIKFRYLRVRIESLKDQYVGIMLKCADDELRAELLNCLKTTYDELLQYCDWLKHNKIAFLQKHLAVLSPSDFSFTESSVLQPLVKTDRLNANDKYTVLIPPVSLEAYEDLQLTGSFGKYPLLNFGTSSLSHKVLIDGVGYEVNAILKNNKELKELVKRMVCAQASVNRSIERKASFTSQGLRHRILLLLDVSGSMSGKALDDLKQAVSRLSESAEVEWIAFNDNVVSSSFDEDADLDRLASSGGTNFIPPLKLAIEKLRESLYDEVILISDGCPFEATDDILAVAYELQQPLNTISIGQTGADVMQVLSEKTSGVQVVVQEVREIVQWEGKMHTIVHLGETGDFMFGELLAKCHIPGCALAVRSFVASQIASESATLSSLIAQYPDKGLAEWSHYARRGAALTQTATVLSNGYMLGVDKTAVDDNDFRVVVEKYLDAPELQVFDAPLMVATLVSLRGVALCDFVWAGLNELSADLNNREQLAKCLCNAPILNLYNKLIR